MISPSAYFMRATNINNVEQSRVLHEGAPGTDDYWLRAPWLYDDLGFSVFQYTQEVLSAEVQVGFWRYDNPDSCFYSAC